MAHISPSHSLLERACFSLLSSSSLPGEVDGLVGGFAQQATDWRALAAMTAGGLAYRAGRLGALGLGGGSLIRAGSAGLGLGAEVSTFELSHRALSALGGRTHPIPNLWRWSGSGGLAQGLVTSFITFGTLKGAGRLVQGQNLIAQHLFQDTAMVLGHQASGALGVAPGPHGTLAEQFLHAEAANLQLSAGMALAHGLAPSLQALESGLALSHPFKGERPRAFIFLPALASGPRLGGAETAPWNGTLLMSAPKDPKGEPFFAGGFLTWTGLQHVLRPFRSEDLAALTLSAEHNPKFVFLLKRNADLGDAQALETLKNLRIDYLARFALKMPEAVQALGILRTAGNRRAGQELRRLDVTNLAARALGDPDHMKALALAAGYGDFGNPGAVKALKSMADKNLEALSALHKLAFTGNEEVALFLRQLDLNFLAPLAETEPLASTLLALLARQDHPQALPLLAGAARKQGTEVAPLQNLVSDEFPGALAALEKAAETNFRAIRALGNLVVEEHSRIPGVLEALENAAKLHTAAAEHLDSLAQDGEAGALEALFRVSDVNPEALPLLYSLTESENPALNQRAFQVLTGGREREEPGLALSAVLEKLREAPDLEALRNVLNALANVATQDPAAVFQLNEIACDKERPLLISFAKNRLRDLEISSLALQAKWNPRAVMALALLAHWRNLEAETTLPTIKPRDLLQGANLKEAWVALHLLAEASNTHAWDAFLSIKPSDAPPSSPLSGKDYFGLFLLARGGNETALDILSWEAESDPRAVFILQDLLKNSGILNMGEILSHMPVENLVQRALRNADGVQALGALSSLGNKEAQLSLQNLDASHYTAGPEDRGRFLGPLMVLASYGNKLARAHIKTRL